MLTYGHGQTAKIRISHGDLSGRQLTAVPFESESVGIGGILSLFATEIRPIDGQTLQILTGQIVQCFEFEALKSEVEALRDRERTSAIRRAEQLKRLVLDSVPVGLAYLDRDRNYLYANKTYSHWYGEPGALPNGEAEFDHRQNANAVSVQEALEGKVVQDSLSLSSRDGQTRVIESTWIPDFDGGQVVGIMQLGQDITRHRVAEAGLEQKVKERTTDLESALRELEGLTHSVAHDLRAPVRAIASTSRILMDDYSDILPQCAVDQLRRQTAASMRLGNLIDDLLRLAKLARWPMERTPLDISTLATMAFNDLTQLSHASTLQLEVQPDMTAVADRRMVRLALSSLLDNALKFSPNGGTIRVGQKDGAFFVADEGIGFDMSFARRLFKPFERLVPDGDFTGTGVGLAHVRRITERHGGTAWAEGEPGKGATIWFTLG